MNSHSGPLMSDETAPEPTMDEILASIRRIIADDGSAPPSPTTPREEPLLLTERVDPEPLEAPMPMPMPMTEPEPIQPAAAHPPTPTPAMPAAAAPASEETADAEWIGQETVDRAADALETLSSATRSAPPVPAMLMPPPDRTLEDVVRDLLRPMVKEWLDENLPGIVQDRVDEEVERIARRRVR